MSILMLAMDITAVLEQLERRHPRRRRELILVGLAFVAACSSGDDDDTTSTEAPTAPPSSVATSIVETTVLETTVATTVATTIVESTAAAPESFPAPVDGYVPDGGVQQGLVSVVPGTVSFAGPLGAPDDCDSASWTMRWRTQDTTAPALLATTSAGAVRSDEFDAVLSDLTDEGTPVGTSGSLTGGGCSDAAFAFPAERADVNEPVDVAYEWQLWVAGADVTGVPEPEPTDARTSAPATVTCDAYGPTTDPLPIQPCTEGLAVLEVQDRLTQLGYALDVDGLFGPATFAAVVAFQIEGDQIPDGTVGLRTWARLFEGVELRGVDLDDNGIVTPEEIIYD